MKSEHWPGFSSLNTEEFVFYMSTYGWTRGGTFVALLSAAGHHFHEFGGKILHLMDNWWHLAPALSLLIFEL